MAKTRDINIHGFESRLTLAERLVRARNPISPRNAELISNFENHCFSEDLSKGRVVKYVLTLKKIAEWLEEDFDEVNRGDIERFMGWLERSDYSA